MTEFSNLELEEQLNRILHSNEFKDSKKLQVFLSYIVKETLSGDSNQLKQYNIAVGAFDREASFDPNQDPIVRIQAGRLRSSISSYYRGEGKDDPILIEVPVGSYVPKITKKIASFLETNSSNGRIYQDEAIALIPFANLSNDTSKQFVVDGFTEELLLEMARYNHLTIIRMSEESEKDVRGNQWAMNRYARFIIRGSLRLHNSKMKLVISLEDAKDSEQVWSNNFEFEYIPNEILLQQEKIAREVANKVGDVLGGVVIKRLMRESKNRIGNEILPYDSLLMFYQYLKEPIPENIKKAYKMSTEALKIDPDSGTNWAILGTLVLDDIGLDVTSGVEYTEVDALNFTTKGVELEPEMQFTRAMYANALLINNQLDAAIKQGRRAYKLNPNAAFYTGSIGWVLLLSGAEEEGLELIEEGIYLSPGYPKWYHLATCVYYLGKENYQRALEEANKLNIQGLIWDPLLKAACMGHLSRADEAKVQVKRLENKVPDFTDKSGGLIDWFVKDRNNKEIIIQGLKKAGMNI